MTMESPVNPNNFQAIFDFVIGSGGRELTEKLLLAKGGSIAATFMKHFHGKGDQPVKDLVDAATQAFYNRRVAQRFDVSY